jgi:hypothetical protein
MPADDTGSVAIGEPAAQMAASANSRLEKDPEQVSCPGLFISGQQPIEETTMKTFLATAVLVAALAAPAFAETGNLAGSESRGEPINSSVRSSARDPQTGLTPGGMASRAQVHHVRALHLKKKRHHVIVRESAPRGY